MGWHYGVMVIQHEGAASTDVQQEVSLAQAMVDLADAMSLAPDLASTAQAVADAAVAVIPGVEQASVSLARRGVGIDTVASAGPLPLQADSVQVDAGEGPCIEAAWEDHIARLPDTATDQQWPQFSRRARDLGVGSMLSFQLSLPRRDDDDERIGAINTYASQPHAFDGASERVGLIMAVHAAVGVGNAEREEQLHEALESRDLIGQAKGLIMAQQGVEAGLAFNLLVRQSRDTNTRLRDLAARLVDNHRAGT